MVKSGEPSSYHPLPISPTASVSESNSINVLPSTSVLGNNPVLSSLNDPQGFKYEEHNMNDDVEIQSPDNSAIWNSYFADNDDEASFMISSPRSSNALDLMMVSSPKRTQHMGFNQNYDQGENTLLHGESMSKYSPASSNSSHMVGGTCNISNGKSKGQLQRVFSSPRKKYMKLLRVDQFSTMDENMNGSSTSKDGGFREYSTMNMPSLGFNAGGSESGMTLSAMLKCLPSSDSSNIWESTVNKVDVQRDFPTTQEKNASLFSPYRNPFSPAQLSQQQEQQYTFDNGSFGPLYAQEQVTGLQLLHLLLACAEAAAKKDYIVAKVYLGQLNRIVNPLGDSMQRVACCFTEALSERLSAITTANPNSTDQKNDTPLPDLNSLDTIRTYQVVYQACPYLKFAHFTANQAIFEAFEGEERVHVVDFDILQGYQWPSFMQALAARQGGAPFLRLTGIGSSPTSLGETGLYLTEIARSLKIPFEFEAVSEPLEEVNPHIFQRRLGEALAVNSINVLHRVSGNSLANLLGVIHDQTPEILILVEQEASHNGPYFLGRFLEALHYYSAIFDSMEATFLSNSEDRAKVEKYIYAPEIRNIVASDGPDRVERHEKIEKWRKVMEGKGFKGIPLSENAVTQANLLLGLYSCDGYRLTDDKGCLMLGWQDRPIIAASSWRC
ncbi:DELLA protein RGL1-like [Papaver somniferum]|nr:DELLA protein RGL1-like [Papaver somniferum]